MLPEDNSLRTHPILFQTPVINKQLDDNPNLIRVTNPARVWDPSDYGMDKKTLYNPEDPPLTPAERAALITQLRPIARKTFSNVEGTLLFYTFMSRDNLEEIHRRIQHAVFQVSGFRIGKQSESELSIAMNNIYNSYANNLNENLISKHFLAKHIRAEVDRLNTILLKWVVPIIVNSAEQRYVATQRFENPIQHADLPLPVSTSIAGTREYRGVHDVLTGTNAFTGPIANTSSLSMP